jgi:hypothetical protein
MFTLSRVRARDPRETLHVMCRSTTEGLPTIRHSGWEEESMGVLLRPQDVILKSGVHLGMLRGWPEDVKKASVLGRAQVVFLPPRCDPRTLITVFRGRSGRAVKTVFASAGNIVTRVGECQLYSHGDEGRSGPLSGTGISYFRGAGCHLLVEHEPRRVTLTLTQPIEADEPTRAEVEIAQTHLIRFYGAVGLRRSAELLPRTEQIAKYYKGRLRRSPSEQKGFLRDAMYWVLEISKMRADMLVGTGGTSLTIHRVFTWDGPVESTAIPAEMHGQHVALSRAVLLRCVEAVYEGSFTPVNRLYNRGVSSQYFRALGVFPSRARSAEARRNLEALETLWEKLGRILEAERAICEQSDDRRSAEEAEFVEAVGAMCGGPRPEAGTRFTFVARGVMMQRPAEALFRFPLFHLLNRDPKRILPLDRDPEYIGMLCDGVSSLLLPKRSPWSRRIRLLELGIESRASQRPKNRTRPAGEKERKGHHRATGKSHGAGAVLRMRQGPALDAVPSGTQAPRRNTENRDGRGRAEDRAVLLPNERAGVCARSY